MGYKFDPGTNSTHLDISKDGLQKFRKGMDVAGGVKLTYKIDFSKYKELYKETSELDANKKNAIAIILKNIDKRVSSLGVSDYTARQQIIGEDSFIVIEIGWIDSLDTAKAIIWKTVELEFKVDSSLTEDKTELFAKNAALAKDLFGKIKENPTKISEIVWSYSKNSVSAQAFSGEDYDTLPLVYQNNRDKILSAKSWDIIDLGLGGFIEQPSQDITSTGKTIIKWYTLLLIDKIETVKTPLTSWALVSWAKAETILISAKQVFVTEKPTRIEAIDPKTKQILNGAFFSYATVGRGQVGWATVNITFNDKWKEIFCNLTKLYVKERMAIFVWGELLTSPTIDEPICEGTAQISGQPDAASAKVLAEWLNEGALPAPLILSQEEKVSALLGDDAMQWAMIATAVSLILILIMLLILYEWKIAILGFAVLISYAIYVLAIFKIINYAFSLSGIAAMILSLGMGVDANILIFERLKEELVLWKSWTSAVEAAHARSRSAILDGNITTILIFIVLFFMGMSIFKWFWFAWLITWGLILLIIVPLTKHLLLYMRK